MLPFGTTDSVGRRLIPLVVSYDTVTFLSRIECSISELADADVLAEADALVDADSEALVLADWLALVDADSEALVLAD